MQKPGAITRDFGPQPLDGLLTRLEISNHTLVEASCEHLTHKEVMKGRKGRRLSANLMGKIARAMNRAAPKSPAWDPAELFTYAGTVRKCWNQPAEQANP